MDSADSDPMGSVLQAQSHKFHQQGEQISLLRHYMKELTDRQDTSMAAFSTQLNFPVEQMQKLQTEPAAMEPTRTALPGSTSSVPPPVSTTASAPIHLSRP